MRPVVRLVGTEVDMASVGAYEAKSHFAQLLDRVERGERITITRHGVPVAVLQPPGEPSRAAVDATIEAIREFRTTAPAVSTAELQGWLAEGRR